MTEYLAKRCSDKIINIGAAPEEKRSVLKFGLELLFSSVISVTIVASISIIAGHPLSWIFFLGSFIPLRLTAGGYHASTHLGCNITFAVTYILCLVICRLVLFQTSVLLLIASISFIIILIFSPVEAINKPLNSERRRRNRIKSIFFISVDIVLSIILMISCTNNHYIQMYFLGIFAATVSQIAALIINKKGDNKNESKT